MPQPPAGKILTPGQPRPAQQAMEVTHVQVFEDRVEIVNVALRKTHSLATARLPDHLRLSREVPAADVAPVARTVPSLDPRPVNLGQQDVGQRSQNALRRTLN